MSAFADYRVAMATDIAIVKTMAETNTAGQAVSARLACSWPRATRSRPLANGA
jgi:hypothetical protein